MGCAQYCIYLGQIRFDLFGIALGQTAGHQQIAAFTTDFMLCSIQYRSDGFLFRGLDKTAGVHNNGRCLFRVGRQIIAGILEDHQHIFGVYLIFWTSQ